MNKKVFFIVLTLFFTISWTLCYGFWGKKKVDTKSFIRQQHLERLTTQAFEKIEPILENLKPDTPVKDWGLKWKLFSVNADKKTDEYYVLSDGWLQALSGGMVGGLFWFGDLFKIDGKEAYGEHIFGYIWDNINFVPCYSLKTKGIMITQEEKDTCDCADGYFILNRQKQYVKELKIYKIDELNFSKPNLTNSQFVREEVTDLSYAKKYLSHETYNEALIQLTEIKKGCGFFQVIEQLGGSFVSFPPDSIQFLGVKGFLNYKGTYNWYEISERGVFSVWAFGYVENDAEVPKIAMIFKNGSFLKLVPYGSKDEIKSHFSK